MGSSRSQVCMPRAVGWDGSCHSGLGSCQPTGMPSAGKGRGHRHGAACTAHSKVNTLRRRPRLKQLLTAQAPPSPRCTGRSPGLKRAGALRPGAPPGFLVSTSMASGAGAAGSRAWAAGCRPEGGARLCLPPRRTPRKLSARACRPCLRECVDFVAVFLHLYHVFTEGGCPFSPPAATDQETRTGSSHVAHVLVAPVKLPSDTCCRGLRGLRGHLGQHRSRTRGK